ncbi:MAG: 5'-nucleotidase, partial [Luminiphilus sp.]
MAETGAQKLVIAISSRALFNLDDAHRIFEQEGLDAYSDYQVEKEDETTLKTHLNQLFDQLLPADGQIRKVFDVDYRNLVIEE